MGNELEESDIDDLDFYDGFGSSELDLDELEEEYGNSAAESCSCGAYQISKKNGRWLHVADCCC